MGSQQFVRAGVLCVRPDAQPVAVEWRSRSHCFCINIIARDRTQTQMCFSGGTETSELLFLSFFLFFLICWNAGNVDKLRGMGFNPMMTAGFGRDADP